MVQSEEMQKCELLQPVEHLPLHAVLELAAPDHGGQHALDLQKWVDRRPGSVQEASEEPDNVLKTHLALRVLLFGEVSEDSVLGNLGADGEPLLKLLLDSGVRSQ